MKAQATKARSRRGAALLALLAATCSGSARAHHSVAMFDREKLLTVTGVVKEVQWTNPHVGIYVEAPPAKEGEAPTLWVFELTSPGNLVRLGWSKGAVKVGDKVTVEMHPLRNGGKGGWLSKVTLAATGQVYTNDIFAQEKANLR